MCKILILSAHAPASRAKLISRAWDYFAQTGETDGFGAAWITRSGTLGWAKSSSPLLPAAERPAWLAGFSGSSGDEPSNGGWLLLHGRRATCGVSLDNTHPMLDDGAAALIHNGVVSSETVHNVTTTCDSELLLRAMLSGGVAGLEQVNGYYAFGMLKLRRDGWHAAVVRDDTARLRFGRGRAGASVWGTTDDALRIAGATPLGDHAPNTAALFAPSAAVRVVPVTKAKAKPSVADDFEERWAVASGRKPRLYSPLLGGGQ
jgi:hypothetical protein